jgi:hypothetical protein
LACVSESAIFCIARCSRTMSAAYALTCAFVALRCAASPAWISAAFDMLTIETMFGSVIVGAAGAGAGVVASADVSPPAAMADVSVFALSPPPHAAVSATSASAAPVREIAESFMGILLPAD